nr:sensor histidine kinase [Plantactinospora sp. KBS50]
MRRPVGRLRDMPIWSKLGLIMIVPTIATIVVGTSGLIDHLGTLTSANRAHSLANLSQASGDLVNNLQDERTLAIRFLDSPSKSQQQENFKSTYTGLFDKVERSRAAYSERRQALGELPTSSTELLGKIDQDLADLPGLRSQVVNGRVLLSTAVQTYDSVIAKLLDMRDSAAQLAGDPALSERMRAASSVSRAKEFLSQRRAIVHQALAEKQFLPARRTTYIGAQQGQQQAVQSFKSAATDEEVTLFEQTIAGSAQRTVELYSGWVTTKATENNFYPGFFNAADWDNAMAGSGKQYRDVESELDERAVDLASKISSTTQRQVVLDTGLLLGILLLSILFAWIVARSMAQSLRELRHGALAVAQYGLPQAVSRLRDPQVSAQMSPAQVANQIAEPLPVRSRDEFGQVTEAFNAVHLEAVRTAAEQAALRSSVATMFVNLARRSQILVDRLIGHLDRLERGEEDPDRLAELFQLDHLATRMRRNDENLLVLAGADSTRVQRDPAALMDVLRAAQSEVEHYTRIEFGIIDRDIEVASHAVNDLVHLVAELFDNATAFSPPDSQVMVEARRVGDRASLYVEDRGIGITAEQLDELNERLATPPQVDVAVSRMMGLVVVARLAARHGVRVELRPGADRGTVADVTLPPAVLVPRALAGRGQQQPGALAGAPSSPAAPMPTFGAPLALESRPALPTNGAGSTGAVTHNGTNGHPGGRPQLDGGAVNGVSGRNAGPDRGIPAWSDLTGAGPAKGGGTNGGGGYPPRQRGESDPLPQRRSEQQWTVEGEVADGPQGQQAAPADRDQRSPESPQSPTPASAPPAHSAPPVSSAPPGGSSSWVVAAAPVSGPAGAEPEALDEPEPEMPARSEAAPPAWPPGAGQEREAGSPQVPERLAAALDMTAELPRMGRSGTDPSAGRPASTPPAPAAPVVPAPRPAEAPLIDAQAQTQFMAPVTAPDPRTAQQQPPAPYAPPSMPVAESQPASAQRPAPPPSVRSATDSRQQHFADETMELPIFRELESAWFRTRRSASDDTDAPTRQPSTPVSRSSPSMAPTAGGQPAGVRQQQQPAPRPAPTPTAAAATEQFSAIRETTPEPPADTTAQGGASGDRNTGTSLPSRPASKLGGAAAGFGAGAAARRAEPTVGGWRTAADDGWRAASAANEVPVKETTPTGLPKRKPMAQLVPGGVEKPSTSVQRRTPESVRGLLSAYHRGVQRGRTHPTDDNAVRSESAPAGRQSSQPGSGRLAGSGQKEHEG